MPLSPPREPGFYKRPERFLQRTVVGMSEYPRANGGVLEGVRYGFGGLWQTQVSQDPGFPGDSDSSADSDEDPEPGFRRHLKR